MSDPSKAETELFKEISALKKRIQDLEQSETDRKQAEKALRESEKEYQNIFENAVEGIFRTTGQGRFSNANPAAAHMLGYESPEELINSMTDIATQLYVNPEDRDKTLELLLKHGVIKNLEAKCRHKTGNIIWGVLNMQLVKDGQGNILYIEGTCQDITERKQAEEALRDSKERYRQLVESINKGVFVAQDGMLKFVNPMSMEIFVRSKHDLTSLPFTEFIHPDDSDMVLDRHMRRLKGEKFPTRYEFRILSSDGKIKWVELDSVMMQWEGKPAILGFIGDITERKQIEEELNEYRENLERMVEKRTIELKESESKYKALFDNANDAIFLAKNYIIVNCNRNATELFGCSREQIIGQTPYALSPETQPDGRDSKEKAIDIINAAISTGPQFFEWRHRKFDGTFFDAEISLHLVDLGKGKYVYGVAHDVTERKRVQEAIRKAEEQYKTLVETVNEWIWETDANGVYTFTSPRLYDILGYKPEEVLGKRLSEFTPHEEVRKVSTIFLRLIAEKKPILSVESICCHKNGHQVFYEINGFPFFDEEGILLGYRGSSRDITEHKKMIFELQQSKNNLEVKAKTVEELNIALKVLLQQMKKEKDALEQRMVSNVNKLVLPYLEKLNNAGSDERQRSYLAIMENNLKEIVSPFLYNVQQLNLSPRETQVANLIKEGKTTKEIADIMGLASSSVDSYRNSIRGKLKITNRKVNLQSYLQKLK